MLKNIMCFSLIILFFLINVAYSQKQEKFSGTVGRLNYIQGVIVMTVLEVYEHPKILFIIPKHLEKKLEALRGEKVILTCKKHGDGDSWDIIRYDKLP